MTVLGSFTTASPGGLLLMTDCTLVGIGEFGDTNGLANTYIDGGTVTAADIAKMKPSAYLINTARAPIVEHEPKVELSY